MADSASGLGLAHTYIHRKRRGEGILLHIVKTSVVHCSAAIFSHIRSKSSHGLVHRFSGFFSADMGMRDSVDWQVGSGRWGGLLL